MVDDATEMDFPPQRWSSQPVELRPLTAMSAALLRQACADVVNDWMGIGWSSHGQGIMNENQVRRAEGAGEQWPSRRPSAARYVPAYAASGFARTTTSRSASFSMGNGRRPSVRRPWHGSERGSSELTRQPPQQQHRRSQMSTDFVYVQTNESEPSYYLIEPCPAASTRPSVDTNRPPSRGARLINSLLSLSSEESSNSAGPTEHGHRQRWWRGGSLRRRKSNRECPRVVLGAPAVEEVAVEEVDLDRPLPALPRLSTWMPTSEEDRSTDAPVVEESSSQQQEQQKRPESEHVENDTPVVNSTEDEVQDVPPQPTAQPPSSEDDTFRAINTQHETHSSTTPTVTNSAPTSSTPNITVTTDNDSQTATPTETKTKINLRRTESRSQKLKRQLSRIMSPAVRHLQSIHQDHVQQHSQSPSSSRQHRHNNHGDSTRRRRRRSGDGSAAAGPGAGAGAGAAGRNDRQKRKPPRDVGIYDHVILIAPGSTSTTVC